jgi:hypothetical protein
LISLPHTPLKFKGDILALLRGDITALGLQQSANPNWPVSTKKSQLILKSFNKLSLKIWFFTYDWLFQLHKA